MSAFEGFPPSSFFSTTRFSFSSGLAAVILIFVPAFSLCCGMSGSLSVVNSALGDICAMSGIVVDSLRLELVVCIRRLALRRVVRSSCFLLRM